MVFQLAKTIPIGGKNESPKHYEQSFEQISRELRDGQVVCIFPEGGITHDGQLMEFKRGLEKILAKDPVPVIPMSLSGLWGSFFSRVKGRAFKGLPKPSRRKLLVTVGPQYPPSANAFMLQEAVRELWEKDEAKLKGTSYN